LDVPIDRPITTPPVDTVATPGFELCQLTVPPSGDEDNVSCWVSSTPTSIAFSASARR